MTILAEYLENVTNRDASLPVMPDMAAMARGEEADDEEEKEATKVSWRNTTVGLRVRKKILKKNGFLYTIIRIIRIILSAIYRCERDDRGELPKFSPSHQPTHRQTPPEAPPESRTGRDVLLSIVIRGHP